MTDISSVEFSVSRAAKKLLFDRLDRDHYDKLTNKLDEDVIETKETVSDSFLTCKYSNRRSKLEYHESSQEMENTEVVLE